MRNQKGKLFTTVSIGTATVWFSTHCGAGFASGTQELQYFANHGWFGPIMPLLTILIIGITYYLCIETARQTDKWNYDAWSKEAFGPLSKPCSVALEISILVVTIAASAASIAAGAELVNQSFHMPIWLGSVIMFIIITILSIFGEKVVRNNAMIMTVCILAIISIIIVLGLVKFFPQIKMLFSTGYVNEVSSKWSISGTTETTNGNIWNAFLWALTYAGFQVGAIGGIASSFKGGLSKRESQGAMILGYILNTVMLCGVCILIFSGMPEIYTNPEARLLPTVYIVKQLDFPLLSILYPVLLFLALVTTAVGLTFGMVQRLEPYILKNMKNNVLRKGIISVLILSVCYGVSSFGLMWVIQVAYKYLGIFSWIFVIIPLWIFAPRCIRKRNLLDKEEDSLNNSDVE